MSEDLFLSQNMGLEDRYVVERKIGAGGMSTVYYARDLKHDRPVALKVLRPEIASVLGADRFLNEVRITAKLSHPHILPLLDSGQAQAPGVGTFLFFVMPYVEGESLRERLEREGVLPIEPALTLARQVAAALECAHQHGVVHRDIKPENILIHEGEAVVTDFGIALAVSTAGGSRLTQTGVSVGTPQYMSPEQATGAHEVDSRTDTFSLAAVLYEMLSGAPPHTATSPQAVISKLLTSTPLPLSRSRQGVPENVDHAILKALSKAPTDRFPTVRAFVDALNDSGFRLALSDGVGASASLVRWRRTAGLLALIAVVTSLLAAWAWFGWRSSSDDSVVRFAVALPADQRMVSAGGTSMALSADGSQMVYVGPGPNGARQLWIRSLDRLEAHPVPGTEGALNPVFSPDKRSVAYLTLDPPSLKVVGLSGAPPMTLAVDSVSQFALDWGPDGLVYFNRPDGRLVRIPSAGGETETVTVPDAAQGEVFHRWVDVLPNGKGALFTIWRGFSESDIGLVSFDTGETQALFRGAMARYSSSGHVVFATADGVLHAAPFDAHRMVLSGSPTPLLKGVAMDGALGAFQFTLSENGTLVYLPGDGGDAVQAVWVSRDGTEAHTDLVFRSLCRCISLSPDGTRIAATSRGDTDQADDIWVFDLSRASSFRLTFDEGSDYRPFWSPDGGRIGFISNRDGAQSIYIVPADGSGPPEKAVSSLRRVWEGAWSPDGRWLLYRVGTFGARDLLRIPVGVDSPSEDYLASPFEELMPAYSPDGRWVAYVSNETGQQEVYVRPAGGGGVRWPVSSGGGVEPVWAHSGRELFYRRPTGEMVSVSVSADPTLSVGSGTVLFDGNGLPLADSHQGYDIGPDDDRFLMLRPLQGSGAHPVVVLNWHRELGQGAPGGS